MPWHFLGLGFRARDVGFCIKGRSRLKVQDWKMESTTQSRV